MRESTLGACKPGDRVLLKGGQRGTVVLQDQDDFDRYTVVRYHGNRDRCPDDSHRHQCRRDEPCQVMGPGETATRGRGWVLVTPEAGADRFLAALFPKK